MRVPWTARISNQSIQKEINPEYSLEGLMLKLKLQYFGHLMGSWDGAGAAERSYPTFKVRGSSQQELPHVQGKEQQLRFAGAAMKIPHVQGKRNPSKMVGTERGHQQADRLKPQSQTTSQSDHTDHSLV